MTATPYIEAYLSHLRQASSSDRTVSDRRRILTVADGQLPYGLDNATEDELREWLWRDGIKNSTRETYYGAVNGFFRWAVRRGMIDFNPCDEIDRPKPDELLPKPVADDQLRRILTEAAEPYRLWMTIAAYTGARCMEIANLCREDINEQTTTLFGKGRKQRVVGTHPVLWEAVKELPAGPITEHDSRYISIRAAVYFRRTMGMPGVSLHKGRHWFGTHTTRLYRSLRVVQQAMGHKDPRTTARYALVAADQVTEAVAMLPRVA